MKTRNTADHLRSKNMQSKWKAIGFLFGCAGALFAFLSGISQAVWHIHLRRSHHLRMRGPFFAALMVTEL